jgi:hypothetical protein
MPGRAARGNAPGVASAGWEQEQAPVRERRRGLSPSWSQGSFRGSDGLVGVPGRGTERGPASRPSEDQGAGAPVRVPSLAVGRL